MGVKIVETTVQDVSGWSVAASNIYHRDFEQPDGSVERRLSAQLVIWHPTAREPSRETVVRGSLVSIGRADWRVARIDERADAGTDDAGKPFAPRGFVVLRRAWIRRRRGGAASARP